MSISHPEQDHGHHIASVTEYLVIFFALMVLTTLTVYSAYTNLGWANLPIAILIACTKATLVILYFMHVRYSSKLVQVTAATGFFFLLVLFSITMGDYMSRVPPGTLP